MAESQHGDLPRRSRGDSSAPWLNLADKLRAEAREVDGDGDFCCALTLRHAADAIAALALKLTSA